MATASRQRSDHVSSVHARNGILGILVAEKFINIELVDKILGSFVTTSWENLKMVMLDIREKRSDPFLCEYFQWLAERLTERMEMKPRQPFHATNDR
jgi:hypothetical protein